MTAAAQFYLRSRPLDRQILDIIAEHPQGIIGEDIRKLIPADVLPSDFARATRSLREWGFIRRSRKDAQGRIVWVVA